MAIPVDDFMASILDNEGWQSALEGSSAELVIARLEKLLPVGSELSEEYAKFLRGGLMVMGELASRLAAGELDEPKLVDNLLAVLEKCHAR